jgi:hypothetical protein
MSNTEKRLKEFKIQEKKAAQIKESCWTSRACGLFVLHTSFKVDNLYMSASIHFSIRK